jgi:ABC-2 type transport system permease protein
VNTALAFETLKLNKSTPARVAAIAVVVFVPVMSAGFLAVARSDTEGPLAAKIGPMVTDTGWTGLMTLVGEILSIAMLLAVGIVTSWSYGREFTDGTFGSLFALPTSLRKLALAKALTLLHWGLDVAVGTVGFALLLGVLTGLGMPDATVWPAVWKALAVALLTVASALRGYLPGIGATIGVVALTQVITVVTPSGGWFPYAAPGMWSGMGGAAIAATINPTQLLLAVPVGLAGLLGTVWWWGRAEVV